MRAFLELFALCGVAVVQPTLDLLGKNPSLFIVWRSDRSRYLALVVLLVVGPPLALWLLEALIGIVVPAARRVTHAVLLGVVAAVICMEIVKKASSLGPTALVILALLFGIGATISVYRFSVVRLWLRFLAIAPVIFALLFTFASPATPTAFGSMPTGADVTIRRPSRVVMIVMDELPLESLLDGNGAIDAQLYPNFAALAAGSTWYRNNTTVAPYTDVAVPAILTGRLPDKSNQLAAAAALPENLFTLLGNSYDLNVHESVTALCPESLCPGSLPSASARTGFRAMVSDTFRIWRDFAQPERTPAFSFDGLHTSSPNALRSGNRFVRSLKPSAGPRLDFLHLLMPHFPWHYLDTGQEYIAAGTHGFGFDGLSWSSDWAALSARQRHLLQVQATDNVIGSVVARLRAIGEYDSTMVVVTADHGASFIGNDRFRGVSAANYPQILWTPLVIKAPNQTRGSIDDRCAHTIDVLPTVMDQLGVDVPWQLDGRSLLDPPRTCRTRRVFEWDQNTLEPTDGSKYVSVNGPAGFSRVLQSSAAPPGERALRLYGIGKYRSLMGREAAPFMEAKDVRATAMVDSVARYATIVPDAPRAWWPMMSGWVGIPQTGVDLAVIVNGRIAGLAQTYGELKDGRREFSTMIPTAALQPKDNVIELARIDGDAGSPRLRRIPVTR